MNEPQSLQEKIAKSWNQTGARKSVQADTFSMYLWGIVGFGAIIFLIKEYLTAHNSTMIRILWVFLGLSLMRVVLAYFSQRMVKGDVQPKKDDQMVEGEVVNEDKK